MQTSYFSRYKEGNGVSIAGKAPEWFSGRQYKKLAPKYWFFAEYKENIEYFQKDPTLDPITKERCLKAEETRYMSRFYTHVLSELNAKQVFEELGEDAVLLCWEAPGKFCHRRLVAGWLQNELGILVPEYKWE